MAIYKRILKGKDGKKRVQYYFSFRHNKKQITGTAKGVSHIRAEVARAEQLAMQSVGKGLRTSRTPLLTEFIDDVYLPWAKRNKASHYEDGLACVEIKKFFKGERLAEITAARVRKFAALRADTPTQHGKARANATVNREMSILSKIFTLAIEEELIELNPCHRVKSLKPAKPRLLYWSDDDEANVMEFLTGERAHLKPILMTFLYTGMRQKELFQMTVDRLDFETSVIHVCSYKGGGVERIVAMEPILYPILHELTIGRPKDELIFPSTKTGNALTSIKTGLAKACELAGVRNIGVHGLRHTRGTRLALRGWNSFQIAAELGHADVRTTQRYIHLAEASRRAGSKGKREEMQICVALARKVRTFSDVQKLLFTIKAKKLHHELFPIIRACEAITTSNPALIENLDAKSKSIAEKLLAEWEQYFQFRENWKRSGRKKAG